MALTSPGVQVTITDESQYLPAPTNSVPLVLLATAQNKANASGTGVAVATTAANANKLFQVTSQRDLVNLYGSPFFYTTTNGTPIQGYELNEYGLLAAYSLLGVTNRCYVLRCDIDLASLVGQTGRPTGNPDNGTYWLDTASGSMDTTTSTWGIYEFNATTGKFALQQPIVITDTADLNSGTPLNSIGNIGDYAVNSMPIEGGPTESYNKTYFYKTTENEWHPLGTSNWRLDIPCIQGSNSNPALNVGDTFTINMSGLYTATITVPADDTVEGVAGAINDLGWTYLSASVRDGKLCIFSNQVVSSGQNYITLSSSSGSVLTALGITAKRYNQPVIQYGTSAQMPLWTSSQSQPQPTGAVWIKVGSAGNGLQPSMLRYNSATASWVNKIVPLATSDWTIANVLDATGGKAIPAGSIYAQYAFNNEIPTAPLYIWERAAIGATIVTGNNTEPLFSVGPKYMNVYVSVPGSSSLSTEYNVTIPDGADATGFVTAWAAAGIPYTSASVTTEGSIQLVHTEGGEIILDDTVNADFDGVSVSNGAIEEAGFVINAQPNVKYGPACTASFTTLPQSSTTGSGSGATITLNVFPGEYVLAGDGISGSGGVSAGYALGDRITINGSEMNGVSGVNDLTVIVTKLDGTGATGAVLAVTYESGVPATGYRTQLSNWVGFDYASNDSAPAVAPANSTIWFYSVVDQVDIMVQKGGAWIGYRNTNYDTTGAPASSGTNTTDINGPIISASEPTTQSTGDALSYGDLWIDTSNLEVYPVISRWELVGGVAQWVLLNNTDQVSSTGVTFLDARWATNGTTSPVDDPIPTIKSLLSSNYLDLDAPNPALYPQGMLLFNTRRSGYNVKQFRVNYFNSARFPDQTIPTQTDAWVTASGNKADGSPYMGRQAQRAMVVQSLRSAIDTNTDIRDEDNYFNLMATPNYPELQPNMVVLNADRGETGYIIGDTPLGLSDSATDIQAWANNDVGAVSTGEAGLVTRNTYLGLFYPSGITNDLNGNEVVVPASHMMLRTFLRNDNIAYPWLAAAGTRRGNIDNALNIGYLDRTTGEFTPIKTRLGIRDVLYINQINPLVFFTGIGLLNYGNKNSYNSQSALDRTNVARLINYVRRQLTLAARPFVFEPNDALTRNQIAGVVQTLMVDLVAKRGIYDYLVQCDDQNNTPARIDRNELWVDVAIEPVKAAEFIYIPVRVLNTGEISGV